MRDLAVIILAAGKGTRMQSELPKVCFELAGKTLIERVVETSQSINAEKIVVVVGYKSEMVIECLSQHKNIEFAMQVSQNGTGDAVKSAAGFFVNFEGYVFILCGDVPLCRAETLQKMLSTHIEHTATATVLTMKLPDPARYGRIVRDKAGNVERITEFRDADEKTRKINEINTGIYCFNSVELFSALEAINDQNEQAEYYLTDVLGILYGAGKRVMSVELYDIHEATGVNSQEELAELEKVFLSNYQ
jgi:UDP-N-acetylglucosamine diphosphorylase/glucosamine-1-phosphate N-acetyltransferase